MAGNINAAHRLTPPDISVGGLAKLASPIFVANLAVMGNATIDTIMAGRLGAEDLAAVALASASTGCIFMLLVGIVQGLSPICGHHFGARKFEQIGFEINQSLYLVLLLSIFGIGILSWTSFWTELGGVTGRIASLASLYLIASAVAVPAALLNRVFISVNAAINQPRITMWISLLMLALKAPVNALFMYGLFGLPELGGAGAGVGNAVLAWFGLIFYAGYFFKGAHYKPMHAKRWFGPSFDADTNLLDGVSFDIQAGERVGLLGRNGAGKTTLFKILTGELDYNTGEVRFAPGRKVGLISQIPHYPAGYTVEDVLRTAFRELANIQSKMRRLEEQMAAQPDKALLAEYDALSTRFQTGGGYETDMQTDKICNGLGIPAAQRQQDFDSLSGGEKTRVNLARLLLEKTDILLLDEPTNHLDMHAVEWLEGYIEKFRGTVLTISHDRYFLDRVVTRIIELHDGKAEFYSGNYSFYVQEKQARFDLQLKQYEKEQAKLGQLGFTLERMKGWGINNRTLYRRAMSIQHRMERIEKTDRPTQEKTLRARFAQRDFFGDEVLSVSARRMTAGRCFRTSNCRSRAANALRCWATTGPASLRF